MGLSFSAAAERKKEKNNYWVVGLNTAQVYCIVCKAPETQPQLVPKPVMSVLNTTVPVVHSDLGADDLESDFLRGTLHLTHVSIWFRLSTDLILCAEFLKISFAVRCFSEFVSSGDLKHT